MKYINRHNYYYVVVQLNIITALDLINEYIMDVIDRNFKNYLHLNVKLIPELFAYIHITGFMIRQFRNNM